MVCVTRSHLVEQLPPSSPLPQLCLYLPLIQGRASWRTAIIKYAAAPPLFKVLLRPPDAPPASLPSSTLLTHPAFPCSFQLRDAWIVFARHLTFFPFIPATVKLNPSLCPRALCSVVSAERLAVLEQGIKQGYIRQPAILF